MKRDKKYLIPSVGVKSRASEGENGYEKRQEVSNTQNQKKEKRKQVK